MVAVYDREGNRLEIPLDQWRDEVLAPTLEAAWDDADRLHLILGEAVGDGLGEHLVDAAKRLAELEPDSERAACALGVCLTEAGDLEGAEKALSGWLDDHEETATVLLNLARLASKRGEREAADETLRRALHLDPNQHGAVDWWGAIAESSGGEAAYVRALEEVAEEPGSYFAQVRLGRVMLDRGETARAVSVYREAAARLGDDGEALMAIAGDLGEAGLAGEALEIAGSVYDPDRHGPWAGVNLARAAIAEERFIEARAMMARLEALGLPALAEHLAALEKDIASGMTTGEPETEAPPLTAVPVTAPVFLFGLSGGDALLPPLSPKATRVRVFSLSDPSFGAAPGAPLPTGEQARMRAVLTRALPLYLYEALRFSTDAKCECVIPVEPGRGPLVSPEPWPLASMAEGAPDQLGPQVIVGGTIEENEVVLEAWSVHDSVRLGEVRVSLDADAIALDAARGLLALLGDAGRLASREPGPVWTPPPSAKARAWLDATDTRFTQALITWGLVAPDPLWEVDAMYEHDLELAEGWACEAPALLFVSRVVAGLGMGSRPAGRFRRRALERLDAAPPGSALAAVKPAVRPALSALKLAGR